MHFTTNKDKLLNQLLILQKALPSKAPYPIFNAIKIEVEADYIIFTTSDSDVSIQIIYTDPTLKIDKVGKIAISGKYFIDIIRKIEALNVTVSLIDDKLVHIQAGRSNFKLVLMDVEDYPQIDFLEENNPINIDSSILKDIIRKTSFAAATNEKRPILTGVNFKFSNQKLITTATDSYRLAQKTIIYKNETQDFNIVVPSKNLDELIKIIDHSDEISIYISSFKILFKINNIYYQTRLLDGTYPDTQRVIPVEFPVIIPFNKEDLLGALERVSLLSPKDVNQSLNIIKMHLKIDGNVDISSNSSEIGDAKEEVNPNGDVIGKNLSIAFSARYLMDSLKSFHTNNILLCFAGDVRPFVLKAPTESDLLHLILPVRID